jgi:hypothetical protein
MRTRMRTRMRLIVVCALGVAVLAQAAPAEAVRTREYRGRTSAGKGTYLLISGRGTDLRLHEYAVRFDMICENGAVQRWSFTAFINGGLPLGADRSFEDADEELDISLSVTGTVGPHEAQGTFEASSAIPDEPTCSSGALTWSAHERDIVGRLPARRPEHVARLRVTGSRATSVHVRAA